MAPWKPPHHAGCTSVDGFPKDGDPFHWVLGAVFTDHLTCLSYEEQSHHCQCRLVWGTCRRNLHSCNIIVAVWNRNRILFQRVF